MLKLEIVIQVFPTVVLGVRAPRLQAKPLLAGLVSGCLAAVVLRVWPELSPLPAVHSGIWALLLNLLVCCAFQLLERGRQRRVA